MRFYLLRIQQAPSSPSFPNCSLLKSLGENLSALNLNSLPYFCPKLLNTCIKKENIGAWHGLYFSSQLPH